MTSQHTWNDVIKSRQQLMDTNLEYWLHENLFSFNWWLLLGTFVSLFIIWILLLDKQRIMEIVTFGLMVALTAVVLDVIGVSFLLWGYPHMVAPVVPPIFTIHLGLLPFLYMMVYQFVHKWKSYFIAMFIFSLSLAFVLEPLLMWLQIYETHAWSSMYSFPIYFLIGVVMKWLVGKLQQLDTHYS